MKADIVELTEEAILPKKVRKPSGRPRNENYLSYKDAREFMRNEMIPSRGKFLEWHDRHKPKAIPRFPYRVYKDWVTWNDFLGNKNEFNSKIGTKWRQLDEAAIYVHSLKLGTQGQWMEYAKTGELPKDIPARPDLVYDGWKSWSHWLGNTPKEVIAAHQAAQQTTIFYVVQSPDVPTNVLTFGIERNGAHAFKERVAQHDWKVIRLFRCRAENEPRVKQAINHLSTPYLGDEAQRIVPNVWEIIWFMQAEMEMITSL